MSFASALKEAFLPTLFARSCDILVFKCDPYLLKARVGALLKEYMRYLSVLNLIAKIPQKRARYTIFLSYFAPRLVWFRVKKRIKLLFVAESRLDSANLQNLEEKPNKKIFSKVFASFCFCKKKNPSNPLASNPSSDLDSAKSGDLRG